METLFSSEGGPKKANAKKSFKTILNAWSSFLETSQIAVTVLSRDGNKQYSV